MKNLENITVVIPYKKNLYLNNILKKLIGKFKEIIIVGDHLEGFNEHKEIKFIPGKYNAAEARNLGANYASKDFIFFLDSDCSLIVDNLKNINELRLEEKKIFAGFYLTDKKFGLLSNTISIYIRSRIKESNEKVKLFSSANFIINKKFFIDVGSFNETMDLYEDVDFNVRASVFGASVFLIEELNVLHHKTYNLLSLIKEGFLKSLKGSLNIFLFRKYYKNIGLNVKPKYFMFVIQTLLLLSSLIFINKLLFILFLFVYVANSLLLRKDLYSPFLSGFIIGIYLLSNITGSLISFINFLLIQTKFFIRGLLDYAICLLRVISKSVKPVQIIQYVTGRCNLRCSHCFYKETLDSKDPGEMSVDNIVMKTASVAPVLWYSITGGEVFIRKDFSELVLKIHEKIRPKFFSLPTNGWYTKKTYEGVLKVLQRLKNGNLILFFSIDGPQDVHDEIRGLNSYKKLQETISKLKLLQTIYSNLYINIVITVQHQNYMYFPKLINDIQDEFKPTAISINLLRYHSLKSEKLEDYILDSYEKAINEYDKHRNKNSYNFIFNSIIKAKEKNQKKIILNAARHDKFTTPCSAGKLSYVVMENGDVKPCEILDNVYGNIKKDSFSSIINNKNTVASENRNWIKDTKCRCTYECANSTNALFNKNQIPGLIKTVIVDILRK
jgi:radical SAM protein with 4Fe4S-binding SPASM domain